MMPKLLLALAAILTVTACANQGLSKDMLNKEMLDEVQPLYQSCLKDYKKTMSDEDAKKACMKKAKESYEKITQA
jgi:hypothetical protein|tara:strand:- start:13792 stop:14016 length:225 start_codon:yes stop_codon:yes gene_type:complete